MIEFPKDNSQPLYKYLLKFFEGEPIFDKTQNKKGLLPMKIRVGRLVEVPINAAAPRPY